MLYFPTKKKKRKKKPDYFSFKFVVVCVTMYRTRKNTCKTKGLYKKIIVKNTY